METALLELRKSGVSKTLSAKAPSPQKLPFAPTTSFNALRKTSTPSENWYSINGGEKLFYTKAVDATVEALRALAGISEQTLVEIEKAMLETFAAKKKKVIKRRWIAQSREALYDNPKLFSASIEIVLGWWLGTN